jgi:hypothetical protein
MRRPPRPGPQGGTEAAAQAILPVLKPTGQIDFYSRLHAVRKRYLHDVRIPSDGDQRSEVMAIAIPK